MIRIDKDPSLKSLLLQEALKARGLYQGELDNWWGAGSEKALVAFQNQLKPSTLTPDKQIQLERWSEAKVLKVGAAQTIINRILNHKVRYEAVFLTSKVPWFIIACLHNMESSGSFSKHLHEGSPLTARTKYVPKGRPTKGSPPFTWEESAIDALEYDGLGKVNWNSLAELLYACERYNGTGYLKYHRDVPSPYLWAGTTIEKPGRYVADGKWSPTATSQQIGVATILKQMESQNLITLPS